MLLVIDEAAALARKAMMIVLTRPSFGVRSSSWLALSFDANCDLVGV